MTIGKNEASLCFSDGTIYDWITSSVYGRRFSSACIDIDIDMDHFDVYILPTIMDVMVDNVEIF